MPSRAAAAGRVRLGHPKRQRPGEDLGAIMVREGLAWAFTRYSVDYVDQQEEARRANRGVHAHDCLPAWEWRAQQRR